MRKLMLLVAFAFALSATAALASTSPSSAERTCRAQQSDANFAATHGGKTFEQFYGDNKNGENAFGECVSDQTQSSSATSAQSTSTASTASVSESTGSQEEQSESSTAEANEHFSGPNPESTEPHHPKPSFAAACRRQRAADAAAFEAKYGTNKNKENALGKCVAAMAKAQSSH